MPVVAAPASPTHELPGTRFTAIVAPSSGSTELSCWRVEIDPGTTPTPHQVTREEVFLVLAGLASLHIDDSEQTARPGDAIVVPADVPFAVGNAGDDELRMLVCLPVGGQARLPEGEPFTPPWAM